MKLGLCRAAALGCLLAGLAGGAAAQAVGQPFAFAGLSLATTRADLMQRYPLEALSDNYLPVAPERAHDHIHEIEIAKPDGTGLGRLRLGFERPAVVAGDGRVLRHATYPSCRSIEQRLIGLFGRPARVDEFVEGDTDGYLNRLLVWERRLPQLPAAQQLERLSLQCGRSKMAQRFEAHTVIIARSSR